MTKKDKLINEMDTFTRHYIVAMLWSTSDENMSMRLSLKHATKRIPATESDLEYAYGTLRKPLYHSGDSLQDIGFDVNSFTVKALEKIIKDCAWFQNDNRDMLDRAYESNAYRSLYNRFRDSDCYGGIQSCAGHDFWLTRCGSGCGFWDRGLPDEVGDALTESSKAFGECYVEVDNRYKIHIN